MLLGGAALVGGIASLLGGSRGRDEYAVIFEEEATSADEAAQAKADPSTVLLGLSASGIEKEDAERVQRAAAAAARATQINLVRHLRACRAGKGGPDAASRREELVEAARMAEDVLSVAEAALAGDLGQSLDDVLAEEEAADYAAIELAALDALNALNSARAAKGLKPIGVNVP